MQIVENFACHLTGMHSNAAVDELTDIIQSVQTADCTRFSKEKTCLGRQKLAPKLLNRRFNDAFAERGWRREVPIQFGDTRAVMDFEKNGIGVEVQFGKYPFTICDRARFQIAHNHGLIAMGVLIVPSTVMARQMSTGVPTFRWIVDWLRELASNFTSPLMVFGIEPDACSTIPRT